MPRSLKVSRRPFIAFAIVLSPLVVIFGVVLVEKGFRSDLIVPALLPFVLYAVILTSICSKRVVVSAEGIEITSYFVCRRFIPFSEIQRSAVQILAEREHPIFIAVFTHSSGPPAAVINLKPFRREDVAWLCALPELKATMFPGLTQPA